MAMKSNNICTYPESETIEKMLEEGNPKEALAILENAYGKDSRSTEVWNDLGVLYSQVGRVSDAVDACCRALEIDSSNMNAIENLRKLEGVTKEAGHDNYESNILQKKTFDKNEIVERGNLIKERITNHANYFNLNTIYFHTTDFCIYKCKQCFHIERWKKDGAKRRYMSYKKFLRYFENFVRGIELVEKSFGFKYQRDKILIHPQGGGEPLIHPQFSDIINYISSRGFPIKLTTNGALLSGERADALFNADLRELHVSIDAATPEVYADVRQKGQFEKVVNNLLQFIARYKGKNKHPAFVVSFINAPHNKKDLKRFCEYWAPQVDVVWIQKYYDTLSTQNSSIKEENNSALQVNRVFCNRLPGYFMIEDNGEVKGCQCGDYIAGNLEEQSFEEIMLSKNRIHMFEYQEKGFFNKIEECRDCTKWSDKISTSNPVIVSINNKAYYAQKSNASLHIRNVYGLNITTLDNKSLFP
jgi:radical SAM protein with 4Fe4S-binding SPASM domain